MNKLFEVLETYHIHEDSIPETIFSLSNIKIVELIAEILAAISHDSSINKDSNFNFVANKTLSGDGHPCSYIRCRLDNIDTLARNSILYADTVLIHNPFDKYVRHYDFDDESRYILCDDLTMLFHIKPLLEEGIFQYTASFVHVCKSCLKHIKAITDTYERKISKAEKKLEADVLHDFSFKIDLGRDQIPKLIIKGPRDIIKHSSIIIRSDEINSLYKRGRLRAGELLTYEQSQKIGAVKWVVEPIMDDILNQNYYAEVFNSNYLTNRSIDSKIIYESQNKKKIKLHNALSNSLNHSIPFISDSNLRSLIQLRKKEGEAFQIYRSSLNKFLGDIKSKEYNLKEAFQDEIQPEIDKMNQTIKASKKLIIADITKDLIVGTTFVSVGLLTNFLSQNLGQIIAGIGGVNYLNKFGDNINKLTNVDSSIKSNKYYFVWKLLRQQKTKKII